MPRTRLHRRQFLLTAAAAAGSAVFGDGLLDALTLRASHATRGRPPRRAALGSGGYGPLVPRRPVRPAAGYEDTAWLALPHGFDYVVFGLSGTRMSDGNTTPVAHDGMAAFPAAGGGIRLIRNHEVRDPASRSRLVGDPATAYDPNGGGGTTTLELRMDRLGVPYLHRDWISLNGTIFNCAGGPVSGAAWLTCEETTDGRSQGWSAPHGYVFRVPAAADDAVAAAPLRHLGRFVHEAVAQDPRSGVLYLTEDNGTESGVYRYLPPVGGDFTTPGGQLQMLKIKNEAGAATYHRQTVGRSLPVSWVTIGEPDPAEAEVDRSAVFRQGAARGGAAFSRLEGCWWGNHTVYFNSTNGGDAGQGQVWAYRPGDASGAQLALVYESPDASVLSFPDNITVSPRRGILLCEDSPNAEQYLRGLTVDGRIFDLALNLVDDFEWAGACFSPDEACLFVNTQGPTRTGSRGVARTYAIWGPWQKGAL